MRIGKPIKHFVFRALGPDQYRRLAILKDLLGLNTERLAALWNMRNVDITNLKILYSFLSLETEQLRAMLALTKVDVGPIRPVKWDWKNFTKNQWEQVIQTCEEREFEIIDDDVRAVIDFSKPFTLTSWERLYALCESVRYLTANEIPGSIVECGVWKGGSTMASVEMLSRLGSNDRDVFLFDTFLGMTESSDIDIERHSGKSGGEMLPLGALSGTLAEVKANLRKCDYPHQKIHFVEGRVEDTLARTHTGPIALLRLDTDWYESTKCELEELFPRLSVGGILIIDDYGHFEGAKKAVDEFVETYPSPILFNRIDYTGRVAVKIA